jgi:hypothetical protein
MKDSDKTRMNLCSTFCKEIVGVSWEIEKKTHQQGILALFLFVFLFDPFYYFFSFYFQVLWEEMDHILYYDAV